jgi:hypothetical protein
MALKVVVGLTCATYTLCFVCFMVYHHWLGIKHVMVFAAWMSMEILLWVNSLYCFAIL